MHIIKTYRIILLLASAVFLAACEKNTQKPVQEHTHPVGFAVEDALNRSSYASASAVTSLGVFGYSTGMDNFDPANTSHRPNLFYNRAVSRPAGGNWSYGEQPVYWPIDQSIKNSFFAYAPYQSQFPAESNVLVSGETHGNPTVTYTLPALVNRQVDLLYSGPVANINRTTNNGKVLYNMRHATAWIAFLIAPQQTHNSEESYTLKTLNFSAINLITRGTLDLNTGTWTGVASSTGLFAHQVNPSPIKVGTVAPAQSGDNYLMLIPVTFTKALNDPMIYISFTFDNGTGGTQDNSETFFSIPFPETPLSAGRIVTYILKISIDGIAINFHSDNKLEDWIGLQYPGEIEVY